jgi:hypothetical protein
VSCRLGRWQGRGVAGCAPAAAGGGQPGALRRRHSRHTRCGACLRPPGLAVCSRALPPLLQGGECGALDERQCARPLHCL